MKLLPLLILAALPATSQGALIITGVTDGDLTGGNPKAIIITATTAIADLSIYGVGSANNGTGTDGEEFTFSGSAVAGEIIVLPANADSESFFSDNYSNITVLGFDSTANINGDDAVELFENGLLLDTYGDPDTIGDGQTWDYTDGYAVRTGGAAGAFDQANYTSVFQGLDGQTEAQQIATIQSAYGFSPVPEPTTALLGGIGLLALLRRRR